MWELLLMAAGVASSVIQAKHEKAVADVNIKREKIAAEANADDRRAELRKQLAAARVAMIGQGGTLGSGNLDVNQQQSLLGYLKDQTRSDFALEGTVQNYENAKLQSTFNGIAGSSKSIIGYGKSQANQGTGVPKSTSTSASAGPSASANTWSWM